MTTVQELPNMSATPSVSPGPAVTPTHSNSVSRRPPRKSTLTQQQKNQKRQRATQDQLVTLEMEFNKNPTPTAVVRERIAQEINMTERSVQIWFQNRRAKIKNIAKKSIENGEDCNDIPESMRRYLALQAMESGKPLGNNLLARGGFGYSSGVLLNTETSSSKVVIHHFACRSLSVGTWRRVGQSAMDLVIFYSPEKCCVTYYINNDSAGYKIEYPFSFIKNITLDNGDPLGNAEGASQRPGGLIVELTRPPNFFMDSSGSGGFYQCGDFTEDQQASQILVHHLGGHPKVLSGQLAKLVALESFQNRHQMYDPNSLAVSAPVSPIMHRPQSQPNQPIAHPHPMSMYHEPAFVGVGLAPPRGHKRQRSRSVPVAVDFSMLRQPIPSFLVPGPQNTPSQFIPQHGDIVAPVPQYHHPNGPMGPTLSIDTSAGFGMDFRQYNPMSATTAPSPSTEFGTPAFFTSAPGQDAIAASNMATPGQQFGLPIVISPEGHSGHIGVTNMTPMNCLGPDPVIANQSPPLTSLGRSSSADFYQMNPEHGMPDDGMTLTDMQFKQPHMTLPFRAPGITGIDDQQIHQPSQHPTPQPHTPQPVPQAVQPHPGAPTPGPDFDMGSMVQFGTIDPNDLTPQPM